MSLPVHSINVVIVFSYRDDMGTQTVGAVGALEDGGQLGVADARLLPGRAHGSWSDPNLDNVSSGKDQGLHHVPGDHIASLN